MDKEIRKMITKKRHEILKRETDKIMKKYPEKTKGWIVNINPNISSLGNCDYTFKKINIAEYLLDNKNSEEELIDTIRHEFAHTLDGPITKAHGKSWRMWAIRLGANPRAKCTAKLWKPEKLERKRRDRPYVAKCKSCGNEFSLTKNLGNGQRACKCQKGITWKDKEILEWFDSRTGKPTAFGIDEIEITVIPTNESLISIKEISGDENEGEIFKLKGILLTARQAGNKKLCVKVRRQLRKLGHKGGLK